MIVRSSACFSLLVVFALLVSIPVLAADPQKLPTGSYQSGPFTFILEEGGTFRVTHANGGGVTGNYKVSGNQVEITDQGGEFVCNAGVGKYTWKAEGETLIFTLIEDPCDGRTQALTTGPLVQDRLSGVWKGTWEQSAGQSGTFQMTIERKSDGKSAGTIRVESNGAELYNTPVKEAALNGNKMSAKYDSPDGQAEIFLEGDWSDNSMTGNWSYRPSGESSYTPAGTWKASRE